MSYIRDGLKKRITEMRKFLNINPTDVSEYDEQHVRTGIRGREIKAATDEGLV